MPILGAIRTWLQAVAFDSQIGGQSRTDSRFEPRREDSHWERGKTYASLLRCEVPAVMSQQMEAYRVPTLTSTTPKSTRLNSINSQHPALF